MMSETVVTMDGSSNNASNNPRQVPTVKTEPGQPNPLAGIRLNVSYFKTIPGILKLVQLGLGIICMACASPAYIGATHWFLFVVVMSFISTLIWSAIYFLSLREVLKVPINWILTELLNTSIKTVLYMIAFIAQLSAWSAYRFSSSSNIAAGYLESSIPSHTPPELISYMLNGRTLTRNEHCRPTEDKPDT